MLLSKRSEDMAWTGLLFWLLVQCASGYGYYQNETQPSDRQLLDFGLRHPKPIGLVTVDYGAPVDLRDMMSVNSDLLRNDYFSDIQNHIDGERVPERIVHPKGMAAWGYFEVTHDVSKYTRADVFNGIGKKTKVLTRPSSSAPGREGSDTCRDLKGFVTKFYTKEGNLDFLGLQTPLFTFNDPVDFMPFVRGVHKNPVTRLNDQTLLWDQITLKPRALTIFLYLYSDYGLPDGWRHMDVFPIHTYELYNKHGERWYARFNFRTEQGLRNLTFQEAKEVQKVDLDYYTRDLYNAIAEKNYPSWRLEMDVMSLHDVQHIDYNPFDVTRTWKKGTYHTVPIGRLVLNQNSKNQFRDAEQAAFSPANLVPGISGPVDALFRGRRIAYRDTQSYRISRNFNKVGVNAPHYAKNYDRDGHPPIYDNGDDSPNYVPNSFHGPVPYVNDMRPKEYLQILESGASDLQVPADFYNLILKDEGEKQRLAENLVALLLTLTEPVQSRTARLLAMVDPDLGRRVFKFWGKVNHNPELREQLRYYC